MRNTINKIHLSMIGATINRHCRDHDRKVLRDAAQRSRQSSLRSRKRSSTPEGQASNQTRKRTEAFPFALRNVITSVRNPPVLDQKRPRDRCHNLCVRRLIHFTRPVQRDLFRDNHPCYQQTIGDLDVRGCETDKIAFVSH